MATLFKKIWYGFFIYQDVLVQMILEKDGFTSWQDFKDFVTAGIEQINAKFNPK